MFHLGTIRGTTITVDLSFIILIVFFVAMNYNAQLGVHYALLWAPVLFVSVLIHELAHAAMFGAFGYGPSQVVLGGMGGVTINQRPQKPWHDLIISVAGPISSFILAGIAFLIVAGVPRASTDPFFRALLPMLLIANIFWGLFNLIPLKPLDGGHAIRSFTRLLMSDRMSFIVSTWVGIVVGIGVALWALSSRSIFLTVFISWYVFMTYQAWQDFRAKGYPGD